MGPFYSKCIKPLGILIVTQRLIFSQQVTNPDLADKPVDWQIKKR